MRRLLLYAILAAAFAVASATSFILAATTLADYDFAMVTLGLLAMHGYHLYLKKVEGWHHG